MARKKRNYEDDDGRVIADMSDLELPNLWRIRRPSRRRPELSAEEPAEPDRPWEDGNGLSPEDRQIYIFAALKAALLIAGVFIAGAVLLIAAMLFFWT